MIIVVITTNTKAGGPTLRETLSCDLPAVGWGRCRGPGSKRAQAWWSEPGWQQAPGGHEAGGEARGRWRGPW